MPPVRPSPFSLPKPDSWPDGLILFDGVCALCNGSVRRVIARDRARRFCFAAIQSPFGAALAREVGLDPSAPHSFAVAIDGRILLRSDAALAVLARLDGLGWTRGLAVFPRPIRNFVYDRVAANRYDWFGRHDQCKVPAPEDRARFLDDTPPPATPRP